MIDYLTRAFPLVARLRHQYRRDDLHSDIGAGLTTAVMLIPQAMAYAMLAGLPPVVGLYASVVPLILYGFLGTSRELAVGPVAMVSLLVASGVSGIAEAGSAEYIQYAVLLAFLVGVFQLGLGLVRGGFLVNFLAHPVIVGFTSAAALIIGLNQLKHLLGVNIPRSAFIGQILQQAAGALGDVDGPTLVLGSASLVVLVLLKRVAPRFPRALVVVVGATLAVWGLDLQVNTVGVVPAGLPSFYPLTLDFVALRALLPTAITISLVGYMESISVAKTFASRAKYHIEPNRELVGLGVANLGGALCGAYPVTGGFSRTAVNAQGGARSGLASIITALVIALALLFLTPLFYHLPKAVLAAIIMAAVFGLIDFKEAIHLWRVKRSDLGLMLVTVGATLSIGIEEGLVAGVASSLLLLVVRMTRPHVAVLGRLPGSQVYRNVKRHPQAETTAGALLLRIDAQLCFANAEFLRETLKRLEAEQAEPVRLVVIDGSSITELDSSAAAALLAITEDYRTRDIELHLAGIKGPVMDVLERAGLAEVLGENARHLCIADVFSSEAAVQQLKLVGAAEVRADPSPTVTGLDPLLSSG